MTRALQVVYLASPVRQRYHGRPHHHLHTWLDPAALLRGDLPAVLALVQQGLASPEHVEFAAGLAQARADAVT